MSVCRKRKGDDNGELDGESAAKRPRKDDSEDFLSMSLDEVRAKVDSVLEKVKEISSVSNHRIGGFVDMSVPKDRINDLFENFIVEFYNLTDDVRHVIDSVDAMVHVLEVISKVLDIIQRLGEKGEVDVIALPSIKVALNDAFFYFDDFFKRYAALFETDLRGVLKFQGNMWPTLGGFVRAVNDTGCLEDQEFGAELTSELKLRFFLKDPSKKVSCFPTAFELGGSFKLHASWIEGNGVSFYIKSPLGRFSAELQRNTDLRHYPLEYGKFTFVRSFD